MTDKDDPNETLEGEELDERFQDLCDKLVGIGEIMLDEFPVPRAYLGRAFFKVGLLLMRKGAGDGFSVEYMQQIVEGMRLSRTVN